MSDRVFARFSPRNNLRWAAFALAALCCWPLAAQESQQPTNLTDLNIVTWEAGPTTAKIGDIALINVPANFKFTAKDGTQKLMQLMQNPIGGNELGLLAPTQKGADWFIVFEFDEVGYIKDDDKNSLDANALLASIRAGTEEGNKLRKQRGWPTMNIEGWEQSPRYNAQSNNLEWAIRATSEGEPIVNYNTRVLGRRGVMKINLVVSPAELPKVLPQLQSLVAGYSFSSGNKYAEFKPGDRVAQYGLAALVTGGAAAVALKSGLLQKFWKVIVIGVVALGGLLKKLFGGGSQKTA